MEKENLLMFLEKAFELNKELVNEAWIAWLKKPAREAWQTEDGDGFKDFLLQFLDEKLEEEKKKLN